MPADLGEPADPSERGYVHAGDRVLLDGRGDEVVLAGVGLGNWLLPEGYMWRMPDDIDSPRRIEAAVAAAVGPDRAEHFWTSFRDTFLTDADFAAIAAAGFDHVRLPVNSRVVIDDDGENVPDGLARIDWAIDTAEAHDLLVVLDLHGAPGGQTGANIDDAPRRRPELFESSHHRELTVHLWTTLADRYATNTTVAGYDLLNEPLPDDYQHRYADRLVDLYVDLTAAIRSVDPHHLIIYEGTHWATNFDIFTEVWDDNSMLSFHRYWCPPDRDLVRPYVEVRDRLGLPLYMGEGGENNLDWIQTAFQAYRDHDISFNFWPWKKVDTRTSPCSIPPPPGWPHSLLDAADPDAAWAVLGQLLGAVAFDECQWQPDVVNAIMGRAPLQLPATGFSFRGRGESWHTTRARPLDGFRPRDQVTIRQPHAPTHAPSFDHRDGSPRAADHRLVVDLLPGDWVSYDVEVAADVTTAVRVTVDLTSTPRTSPEAAPASVHLAGHAGPLTPAGDHHTITFRDIPSGRHDIEVHAHRPLTINGLTIDIQQSGQPQPHHTAPGPLQEAVAP